MSRAPGEPRSAPAAAETAADGGRGAGDRTAARPGTRGERPTASPSPAPGGARANSALWIRRRVRVGAAPAKAARRLLAGEELEWEAPPPPTDERLSPEAGELTVLYEDDSLLAVDKPPGLTVHPGAGRATGTLVHRLLARYPEIAGVGGPGRPGIVHRLDRGTSGVMVIARTAAAYQRLARAFAARQVDKRYLAICHGTLRAPRESRRPIGRHPRDPGMAVRAGGRPPARLRPSPPPQPPPGEVDSSPAAPTDRAPQSLAHPLEATPPTASPRKAPPAPPAPRYAIPPPALTPGTLLRAPAQQRRIELERRPKGPKDLWQALASTDLLDLLS